MAKKLGPLEKGFVIGRKKGLLSRHMGDLVRIVEIDQKIKALFNKYKVEPGNFHLLALELAMKYEPGFHFTPPPGPAKGSGFLWKPALDAHLLEEFDKLKANDSRLSTRKGCGQLATQATFKRITPEGIRSRLKTLRPTAKRVA